MTELLYLSDGYLREFEATVTEVEGDGVVLDRTAFYPRGGGQPSDTGVLRDQEGREYVVRKVQKVKGQVLHKLEGQPPPEGREVQGMIDWDRRYKLMRTHTALHILCGVIWRDYGASVTGGNMEPLKARMDFELERMSAEFSAEVEAKINEEVAAARPVQTRILPREEAFQIPDLIRTKINLLPEGIREVRVVDIEGLDLQADGGTHVANTGEVGRIRVTGHESKGRINKRLRIELEE
ncbi:MAG: Ala-tRNA(Pro) hydrolase [Chloroflexi bacterium B3_Chlor]|nr:MAG: Ala-tRNA(Pro) hydrolase [Chloroflexi bacterium B3_Chlor]